MCDGLTSPIILLFTKNFEKAWSHSLGASNLKTFIALRFGVTDKPVPNWWKHMQRGRPTCARLLMQTSPPKRNSVSLSITLLLASLILVKRVLTAYTSAAVSRVDERGANRVRKESGTYFECHTKRCCYWFGFEYHCYVSRVSRAFGRCQLGAPTV